MIDSTRTLRNIPEMAQLTGIPASWFYTRSRKDNLPGQRRLGRHVRIDVDEFLEALREGKID